MQQDEPSVARTRPRLFVACAVFLLMLVVGGGWLVAAATQGHDAPRTASPAPDLSAMQALPVVAPPEPPRLAPTPTPEPESVVSAVLAPATPRPTPATDGVVHVVLAGETLRGIAERYGVELRAILDANDVPDPDHIAVGLRVFVPGGRALPAPAADQTIASAEPAEQQQPTEPRRVDDTPPPPVTAAYVAVLDEASGHVLWGQDEHVHAAPASITKIATTLVALERADDLDQVVPITISGSAMAARNGSTIMGLEPGQRVRLRTLLYGMMLPSGNDAAEQVAVALAGSREQYVDWMNDAVDALGLQDTHFVTPSGMDARGHYSSAYDMAVLARRAMQLPVFRDLAAAAEYHADGFTMHNLNRLLGHYDGADGVKIGSTPAAGKTMVASATRDGHRIYVTLLRSRDLPGDAQAMLDWVWRTFAW